MKRFRVASSSFVAGTVIGKPFLCYRQASKNSGGVGGGAAPAGFSEKLQSDLTLGA